MSADISVVVAVRNAATTLADALQSLLRQSLPPREIILAINGCDDESNSIASDFARRESTLCIIETSRAGGVAEAAKAGCEATRFPLIARMDSDDVAQPDRFAHQVQVLESQSADLVTCRVSCSAPLGQGILRYIDFANGLTEPADFRRNRYIESPVIQPGALMTRSAYETAGGYLLSDGPEDYDLWLRMLDRGASFYSAPEALLEWRDSATRLTRTHPDYSPKAMTAAKARSLARNPQVRREGVLIAGSGPQGRRMARALAEQSITIHGFFDISPHKIGKTAIGLEIHSPTEMGRLHRSALLLGCVGHGGREAVAGLATNAGYTAGDDFFSCC